MAQKLSREAIAEKAIIHEAIKTQHWPAQVERCFELPAALYGAVVCLCLGFLALAAAAFGHFELLSPIAIFALLIVAGFGIPALWERMRPHGQHGTGKRRRTAMDGIRTGSGRRAARPAAMQVVILPGLILAWGMAAVTIAALVR